MLKALHLIKTVTSFLKCRDCHVVCLGYLLGTSLNVGVNLEKIGHLKKKRVVVVVVVGSNFSSATSALCHCFAGMIQTATRGH